MREIKFRAWESEYEGQMHYSDEEHAAYKDEDGRCSWHIGRAGVHIELWIYSYGPNNPEMHKVVPNQEIMQYTGLKDCNGLSVYEGDILGLTWEEVDEGGTTDWESKHLVIWGGKDYPAFDLKPNLYCEENALSHLACSPEAPHYEVIGNRFENPNLIPTAI